MEQRQRDALRQMLRHLRPADAAGAGSWTGGSEGPMSGIKIVDCTAVIAGPMTSMVLADLGADVIKVEPADSVGDPFRINGGSLGLVIEEGVHKGEGQSYAAAMVNRGKKSVALDLGSDEGRAVLFKLVAEADVFVQNWRPGIAEKLGVDFEVSKHDEF